tara:strand:+ start:62 stop:187 length:126 start_codon:yes stop_codon:yes gene_type:complete
MVEAIKHAFGLCGEPHPSLLVVLVGGITTFIYYIKKKIKIK